MTLDVFDTVRNCKACARERIKLPKVKCFLKLIPTTNPCEHIVINILGPLPRTRAGHQYVLCITDYFSKLMHTSRLHNITTYSVGKAFCNESIFHYGPSAHLLSCRGTQFNVTFLNEICGILDIRQAFTFAYHPQTNGQEERFNSTLVSAQRTFCTKEGCDWDQFIHAIAYVNNSTVRSSTDCSHVS